jgi:hypothetical protein
MSPQPLSFSDRLSFVQHSRMHYSSNAPLENAVDELVFNFQAEDLFAEFIIEESNLFGKSALKLHLFNESWIALPFLEEFLAFLSESDCSTATELAIALVEAGVVDKSDRSLGQAPEVVWQKVDISKEIQRIEEYLQALEKGSPLLSAYKKFLSDLKAAQT